MHKFAWLGSVCNAHCLPCIDVHFIVFCFFFFRGWGGGGLLQKILYGEALLRGQNPEAFHVLFLTGKVALLYIFTTKWYLFSFIIIINLIYIALIKNWSISDILKGPFKCLNYSFPYPFLFISLLNLYPFIYLQSEKGTQYPVWADPPHIHSPL